MNTSTNLHLVSTNINLPKLNTKVLTNINVIESLILSDINEDDLLDFVRQFKEDLHLLLNNS